MSCLAAWLGILLHFNCILGRVMDGETIVKLVKYFL